MSRIAIAVPAISGHLNPATTLGRELMRRGHHVTVFAFADGETRVRAAGLNFHPVAPDLFPAGQIMRTVEQLGRLRGFKALRFTVRWFRRSSEAWMRDLPRLLQEHRTDLLLADQTEPGAFTVGEHLKLPTVILCNALAIHPDAEVPPFATSWPAPASWFDRFRIRWTYRLMSLACADFHAGVNARRRQWKLKTLPIQVTILPQFTHLSQQPEWFDLPRQMPANFRYTGPWHRHADAEQPAFPWERLNGRPLIYASLGTLQNRVEATFQTIAEACTGLDAQLVIALGSKTRTDLPRLAGDPIVVPFAPQVELLRRASLVITHAGLNTALETLAAGVPMVASPITNDQPGVAARLRHIGVAEVLPMDSLKASNLRQAVQKMLNDDSAKSRAQDFAARLKQTDGVSHAADIAEQHA
jgi:zeaxanthin glucosyltransferase